MINWKNSVNYRVLSNIESGVYSLNRSLIFHQYKLHFIQPLKENIISEEKWISKLESLNVGEISSLFYDALVDSEIKSIKDFNTILRYGFKDSEILNNVLENVLQKEDEIRILLEENDNNPKKIREVLKKIRDFFSIINFGLPSIQLFCT